VPKPKISKSQYPDLAQVVLEKPDRTLRQSVIVLMLAKELIFLKDLNVRGKLAG